MRKYASQIIREVMYCYVNFFRLRNNMHRFLVYVFIVR